MNIAIYFEQYSFGGVDTVLISLLKSWPEPQDKIVIFHNGEVARSNLIKSELKNLERLSFVETTSFFNIKTTQHPSLNYLKKVVSYILRPIFFIGAAIYLRRIFIKNGPFDILLSNNGGYPAAIGCLSAILASKRANIPVKILVVHHAATKDTLWLGWFDRLLDHVISTSLDAILSVSFATRKTLIERRWLYRDEQLDLPVIHNGVEIEDGAVEAPPVLLRDLVKAGSTEVLIGIMGRIEKYKGHEDLIHAFAKLKSPRRVIANLIIIGIGNIEEQEKLRRICNYYGVGERVHFLGYIAGAPKMIIKQLDLLVSATRSYEGFGLTLAEAMSAGVPILATNVGAIPEFINDEVGVIIPPSSPFEMAGAIDDFLDNSSAWRAKALKAQVHIKKFSCKKMANQYRDMFLQKLVANKQIINFGVKQHN